MSMRDLSKREGNMFTSFKVTLKDPQVVHTMNNESIVKAILEKNVNAHNGTPLVCLQTAGSRPL